MRTAILRDVAMQVDLEALKAEVAKQFEMAETAIRERAQMSERQKQFAEEVFSCNRAVEQLRGDLGYLVDKADDLRVLRNDFEERTSQIEKGAAARASEGEKTQEWYQGRLKSVEEEFREVLEKVGDLSGRFEVFAKEMPKEHEKLRAFCTTTSLDRQDGALRLFDAVQEIRTELDGLRKEKKYDEARRGGVPSAVGM